MKLETTTTQILPVPMAFLPQLIATDVAPLADVSATNPGLAAPEVISITPLRQAFFAAPVASDLDVATPAVSLTEQFGLTRTNPLLAFAATQLAELSKTAQAVGSVVFASQAAQSDNELRTTKTADKTDGGSLITPAVKDAKAPFAVPASDTVSPAMSLINKQFKLPVPARLSDGTDGGTMIGSESAPTHVPEKSRSPWSFQAAPTLQAKVKQPQDRTRINPPASQAPVPVRDKPLPSSGSRAPLLDINFRIRLDLSQGSAAGETPISVKAFMPVVEFGSWNGGAQSKLNQTSDRAPIGYQMELADKPLSRKASESNRESAEPYLAKFGPLAPVGPDVPIRPRGGRTLVDLRAMSIPLEDRQAAAKNMSKKTAVAKIDEMSADADSQGGQNQGGEPRH